MKRTILPTMISCTCLLALLFAASPSLAQSDGEVCHIKVSEPRPGQEVGRSVSVVGTAKLAAGQHLWVFARHEDFRTSNEWWPQSEGVIDPETGGWKVRATIGVGSDKDSDFDVAVAVFDEAGDSRLRQSLRLKEYPITMPAVVAACPVIVFKVRKTSH